ncbi:MAG: hypothetical protein J5I91_04260 [Bacteroidetes bacterium]|nr:hypothetical protein [Bacteroidota bacterium]
MKKGLRIFSAMLVLFAYILAIGQSNLHCTAFSNKNNTEQSKSFSNFSQDWLSPANGNENIISNSLRLFYSGENSSVQPFVSILKTIEYHYQTFIFHYFSNSKGILVRLRPPDIVFPFHSFW